ncbi:MAG: carboxymuconolactone decarboxylase family protein [Arenicellales bacterium]
MTETLFTRTPREALAPNVAPAWDMLNRLTGEPTFIEVFAQTPDVLNLVMNEFYVKIFFGGDVPQRYKQLARLRLSLVHGCLTCNKQNVPGAMEAGFSQAQVDALVANRCSTDLFTEADLAVIDYTDQMVLTNMHGELSKDLFERLRKHFSEAQILELGVVMAIIGGMAKLSFLLDVVEKESYCPFTPVGTG